MSTPETKPERAKPSVFQRLMGEMSVMQKIVLLVGALALAVLCLMPPHRQSIIPLGSGRVEAEVVIDLARLSLWCLATVVLTAVFLVAVEPLAKTGGRVLRFLSAKLKWVLTGAASVVRQVAPHVRKWSCFYVPILILLLILFLWFVWPTPYTYRNNGLARTNRLTQNDYILQDGEWLPPQEAAKRVQELQEKEADARRHEAQTSYENGCKQGEKGCWVEALAAYDRVLAIDPEFANAWNNKGWVLQELGCWEEALAAYDRVLAIHPKYANGWNSKGYVLGNLGRWEEALAAYDRLLAIDPRDANAWVSKGNALRELGRPEEALAAFDEALAIDPGNIFAGFYKSNLLLRKLGRAK